MPLTKLRLKPNLNNSGNMKFPSNKTETRKEKMNSDTLKGKWKQLSGSAKQQWGELTDDEIKQIDGNKDKLIGKVQEKYGVTRDEAEKRVDDWSDKHDT